MNQGERDGPTWLMAAAIALLALNLRPGVASVGPVLAELQRGLDMGSTTAGVLTALPGLCVAVFGAIAAPVAARAGTSRVLAVAALLVALALSGRAITGSVRVFLALSTVAFVLLG